MWFWHLSRPWRSMAVETCTVGKSHSVSQSAARIAGWVILFFHAVGECFGLQYSRGAGGAAPKNELLRRRRRRAEENRINPSNKLNYAHWTMGNLLQKSLHPIDFNKSESIKWTIWGELWRPASQLGSGKRIIPIINIFLHSSQLWKFLYAFNAFWWSCGSCDRSHCRRGK